MISEIYIQVSFLKHTLLKKDSGVVEGDYNTTKLIFRFDEDVSGKRIVFQMSDPQGDIVMISELNASHEVMLAGTDSEGNVCTLFNEPGLYPFELVMYDTDAKLTSAPGWLTVNKQQVDIDNQIVEAYIPFFDDLLREVGESLQKVESLESSFNNTFAPTIKNTVSDSVLMLHDVSPVEHDLNIKLSSDTLTDFSNVGVSRYGKNLITPQELYKGCYMYEALEYENRNCIKMTSGNTYTISPSFLKLNTQYTVSFWTKSVNFDGAKGPNVVFSFNYSDGTQYLCYSQSDTNNNHNVEWYYTSFTSVEGKTVSSIGVAAAQYQIENYIDTDTFLFEVSDKATEYTPYINPKTVTANADGTVDGLTSISPDMTIMTDTEGVVIDMTYNADTKMYIDNKLAEISTAIVNNV